MRKMLFPLLSILSIAVFSQNTGSVNGKITDKQTNEALPGATVTIKGTSVSVVAGNTGNFSFQNLNPGKIVLVVSYVGYQTVERDAFVSNERSTTVNIFLLINRIDQGRFFSSCNTAPYCAILILVKLSIRLMPYPFGFSSW